MSCLGLQVIHGAVQPHFFSVRMYICMRRRSFFNYAPPPQTPWALERSKKRRGLRTRGVDSRSQDKQDVVGTRGRWEQTLEAERSSPLFLVNFVRLGSVKNSGWDPQSSESSPSSSSARVSTCHPSASFLFPQTAPSIRTRQTLSQEQTLDTSYQAGMDAHVRRGHPVLFGVIALFALIEL